MGSWGHDSPFCRGVGTLSSLFSVFAVPSVLEVAFLSAFLYHLKRLKYFHLEKRTISEELSMLSRV